MLDKRHEYFVTKLNETPEPIRKMMWIATFNFSEFIDRDLYPMERQLALRVKEVEIPSFNNESDSMHYFGIERKLITSVRNAGSINVTILESEHLVGYKSILRWHQNCANAGSLSDGMFTLESNPFNIAHNFNSPKYSDGVHVNTKALHLHCLSYVTGRELFRIRFLNIKPSSIEKVSLTYEEPSLYKFGVQFEYDLAIFEVSKNDQLSQMNTVDAN